MDPIYQTTTGSSALLLTAVPHGEPQNQTVGDHLLM